MSIEQNNKILASDVTTSLNEKAPTSHASSATTYGIGTGSNYGHVKLSDSTTSTSAASAGVAASPLSVKSVMDVVNNVSATANAAYNASLIRKSTNPITNPSDDTTHNWANLGPGVYWFTGSADKLIDQPQGYGMLINITADADIFQIWSSQNSGPVRFRQGNYSGWGNTWQNTATWADSANYANSAGWANNAGNGGVTSVNGMTGAVTVSSGLTATEYNTFETYSRAGYIKLSNGLIIQWGNGYSSGSGSKISFHTAFTANTSYIVHFMYSYNAMSTALTRGDFCTTETATTYFKTTATSGVSVYYIAIGF